MDDLYQEIRQRCSGVWARSRADSYFIFCVGQDIVKRQAFIAWARNQDIGFKPLLGMYRGQAEHSFIANMKDYDRIIPWCDGEETVLHLSQPDARDNYRATLHYLATDMRVDLGRLYNVGKQEALASENWTNDPFFGAYFVCRK